MILHLKHYTHAPNYEATYAIASPRIRAAAISCRATRSDGRRNASPPLVRFPTANRSYMSVVSLEVAVP